MRQIGWIGSFNTFLVPTGHVRFEVCMCKESHPIEVRSKAEGGFIPLVQYLASYVHSLDTQPVLV